MADLNDFSVTGRLTRDAQSKVLPTGTQLLECDIANNTGFGDRQKTMFITVNLWGKSGDGIKPYLLKGTQVAVSGELEQQKWTGKADGLEHVKLVLNCNKIILLGSAPKNKEPEVEYKIAKDDRYEDGIPF